MVSLLEWLRSAILRRRIVAQRWGIGSPSHKLAEATTQSGSAPAEKGEPAMAVSTPVAYITNEGSKSVSVISPSTRTFRSDPPSRRWVPSRGAYDYRRFDPVHVAITPDGTGAYVTDAGSHKVSVINTATHTVTATVKVERNPLDVAVTPDGARAYVTNADSNSVSVINTGTNTVIATVPVGGRPLNVAITPDGTRAYVADAGANSVTVINTVTNTILTNLRWERFRWIFPSARTARTHTSPTPAPRVSR
jgi:YVTN family beta-propeller protein